MKPHVHSLLVTLALATLASACESSAPEPSRSRAGAPSDSPAPSGAQAHGKPGAVPGSHDDWCGEHEVPESLCTRCNPSLVPAFKATGDWCEEHGLPKSQCLACNPDLEIERPPKAKGDR